MAGMIARTAVRRFAEKIASKAAPANGTFVTRSEHTLSPLPYPLDNGLKPAISARALDIHYNQHHRRYLEKMNMLLRHPAVSVLQTSPLEDIIRATAGDPTHAALFNNASQVWNHNFYWQCMCPGGKKIDPELEERISRHFDSFEDFQFKFTENALAVFGSGWTWLVDDNGILRIVNFSNANNPLALMQKNVTPLLCVDLWEHSYYLDFQQKRREYLTNWWSVVNWKFVAQRLPPDTPAAPSTAPLLFSTDRPRS